tara:strand:+ start:21 stop:527 length:507 start_codon:yes stop_codon:yes gene_type:complete
MATRLLLISDTHVPDRSRGLPDEARAAADAADIIVHAGDWTQASVLDDLSQHGELIGVYGNNDGPDLRALLPEIARREIEGVRFAVIHETGDAKRRHAWTDASFPDTDVLIFGHSHIPWDTVTPGGLRLLNPGSPTDRRRQPHRTMMTLTVDAGVLREVTLVPLGAPV